MKSLSIKVVGGWGGGLKPSPEDFDAVHEQKCVAETHAYFYVKVPFETEI